jgi:hypothetical protein
MAMATATDWKVCNSSSKQLKMKTNKEGGETQESRLTEKG